MVITIGVWLPLLYARYGDSYVVWTMDVAECCS